jgi:uncharacterized membrane protein
MKRLPFALPFLLAAACATQPAVYQPVANPSYAALGSEPFWLLNIGGDRIVLRTPEGETVWPRTMRSNVEGVRSWESGELRIVARPGPCTASNERVYEDNVTITLPDRQLAGCGGRLIRPERG